MKEEFVFIQSLFPIKSLDQNDCPSQARDAELVILTFKNAVPKEAVAVVYPIDPDVTGKYACRFEGYAGSEFSLKSDCNLFLTKIPQERTQSLKIVSHDGLHKEVTSRTGIQFTSYENKTLDNSVLLRIDSGGFRAEEILEKGYAKLRSLFNRILRSEAQFLGFLPRDGNSTGLILAVGSAGNEKRNELAAALFPHKASMEDILGAPVTINYSACESACLNQAASCSFRLRALDSRTILQTPLLILSTPTLEGGVLCTCSPDFEGSECQYRKDPCSPNPCHGGESCTKAGHDFQCACPASRHGKRCEVEHSNPCESNPCRNGGTCNQGQTDGSSYFCLCRPGFLGKTCSVSAGDDCQPNPCQNGAECISQSSGPAHRKCSCRDQFYGKYCEKSSLGFSSGSFMSFPPLDPNTNDVSIVFSTNKRNSLLLYNFGEEVGGRSDFIGLELLDGEPRLGFGGSRTAVGSVRLNKFVSDGKWYRILAIRNSKAISLSVSECEESGSHCTDCPPGDPSCYVTDIGHTG